MLAKKHHEFGLSAQTKRAPQIEPELRSQDAVATDPSPFSASQFPDSIGAEALSVVLIGPEEYRRSSAMKSLAACAGVEARQYTAYPQSADHVPEMLDDNPDAVLIDLDSDPEAALELVENICAHGTSTVMVFSEKADPELLVRCMRAGAREFLSFPLEAEVMEEALVRAAARRPQVKSEKKAEGRLLTFMGAKGGAGATMLACNFAVALAKESGQKTILIDLDVPLGDAALNMGITAEFSTIDALNSVERLDARFLDQLLVKHSSGVSVLAAPGRFLQYQANTEAIDWLLHVARQEFENVVVDLGAKLDLMGTAAYKEATTFYLVTQSSIPELRNSNRLVQQFFGGTVPKLEIVINRYESRTLGVSDEHITKALTRPAQWKIPNDYASVRKMQINATPLVLADSAITRQIRLMAKSVTGVEAAPAEKNEKKKGFKLFG
jgi:pilus assembly protein CpaE